MKRKRSRRGILLTGIMLLVLSSNICAQSERLLYPLHVVPLLSGNFGELRATHLHSGLDFKTGGREGLPVICVKDGMVARVRVSPVGYGNALYIEHEGGITTVYGHLNRFVPRVAKVVREMQYAKESFEIDENLKGRQIFFRAGDTIAYSGNSGSSGGPHLHFEVRETESEHALNPLNFLSVTDETGPNVRGVCIYTFSPEGVRNAPRRVDVKNVGKRVYQGGKINVPAGKVGVGIQADDYMKDSWNKLGVYEMKVFVREEKVFELKMDRLSFDQSPWVNTIKDFHQYREGRYVYLSFGECQAQLLGVTNRQGGFVEVQKDSVVDISIELRDINGNCSRVLFQLAGKQAGVKSEFPVGAKVLACGQEYVLQEGKYSLSLEAGALSYPVVCKPRVYRKEKDSTEVIEVFSLTERVHPLLKNGKLSVKGSFPDKSVLCLVEEKGRFSPLRTTWSAEGLEASPRVLGEYTVRQDTVAPVILYTGVNGRKVQFRILDDLSGIASYRVEVNGKWCLFSYDAKNRRLEGSLNEPVFVKGKNHLVVKVEDGVKNLATFETDVYKK